MAFFEEKISNRIYLKSDFFEDESVTHAFTTSKGGVSQGIIKGFNLGFNTKDKRGSVLENYRLLSLDLGFDLSHTVISKQTHTDNIRIVTKDDMGKGVTRESDIEDTDGLITDVKNLPLVVFSADCTPLLLYDKEREVIAAIHAGWRGTVKKIAKKAVSLMKENFECNPENILAAIGPSIGPCCFEFGREANEIFDGKYLTSKEDKYMVDIWSFNKDQLMLEGIPERNIDISSVCTVCNSNKYFSYRAHKERTGRQAALILLKD